MMNRQLPIPKYYQLAETLRHQILSGKRAPGEQMATEAALCAEHRVSRGTVRQAVRLLVDEGLLWREQGRGTFVAEPRDRSQHFSLSSFADEMRRQSRQPSTRLLVNEVVVASDEVAARLGVGEKTAVFYIKRLRLADGQPVAVETRYLAQSLCPQLADEDLERQSLHWLFVQKYQIPLVRMEHVVELREVGEETAVLLQAAPDAQAFHVDRLTFTENEAGERVAAVWFTAVYREDNYYIQTQTI
ncbi:MAG: GntR family transcriptional regulator [Chloroflexota bacterium]